jgi:hypothetical protein
MTQDDDPIIDALLDEVLGGVTPPDVSPEVMHALESGNVPTPYPHLMPPEEVRTSETFASQDQPVGELPSEPISAGLAASAATTPTDGLRIASVGQKERLLRRRLMNRSIWGASAAAAVVVIAGIGFLIGRAVSVDEPHRPGELVTKTPDPKTTGPVNSNSVVPASGGNERVARQQWDEYFEALPGNRPAPAVALRGVARPTAKALSDAEVIEAINTHLAAHWKDADVWPSAPAGDGEWCRRVFLRVLGRVPTVAELKHYGSDKSTEKRKRLVDELLDSDRYRPQYAGHWADFWTRALIGRSGGMNKNDPTNREGMTAYLIAAMQENKSYDVLVKELLTATGTNRRNAPDFNGAVNFLAGNLDHRAAAATAKTAQIFLGLNLRCSECHSHPFQQLAQQSFWEMNSFFRQAHLERGSADGKPFARLVDRDFAGENALPTPERAEVYYEKQNGILRAALPRFLDGREGKSSGFVSEVNRREELANWIVQSESFAPTMANRLWKHFFGYGFTGNKQEMGLHTPTSHPELLTLLGDQFAAGGHDQKKLIRWIVLSDVFSLSSRVLRKNAADNPAARSPLFSHYYARPLGPEQIARSLLASTQTTAELTPGEDHRKWLRQFVMSHENDECTEADSLAGGYNLTMMMVRGTATGNRQQDFLKKLAADNTMKPNDKLEYLYLATLARKPRAAERQIASRILLHNQGNLLAALEDIWWALTNSNEFVLDH